MKCLVPILMILLLAPAVVVGQTPDPKFVITNGVGIGSIKLRMNIDEAKAVLGPPLGAHSLPKEGGAIPRPEGATDYVWQNGFQVQTDKAGRIYLVSIYGDRGYTSTGLRFGLPLSRLLSVMGKPSRIVRPPISTLDYYVYDAEGIWFAVNPGKSNSPTIFGIGVFEPR